MGGRPSAESVHKYNVSPKGREGKRKWRERQRRAQGKPLRSEMIGDKHPGWKNGVSADTRWYHILRTYNMSKDQFYARLESQDYTCPVCGDKLDPDITGLKDLDVVVVDHNHKSGEVRGLIHGRCNRGIGFLRDNPTICFRAAMYLDKTDVESKN